MVSHVTMYSTSVCPYCIRAEQLLKAKGIESIEKIRIDINLLQREIMIKKTGRRTVPQIYIGNTHVGGFDELYALENAGQLDVLLKGV